MTPAPRILHLLDPAAPAGPCAQRLAAAVVRPGDAVVVVGDRARLDRARRHGLPVLAGLAVPAGVPLTGGRLGRLLRRIERWRGRFDALHAWSAGTAAAAAACGRPTVGTLLAPPRPGLEAFRLRRARPVALLAASEAVAATCARRGVDGSTIEVMPPGVEAGVVVGTRDAARRRWGVSPDTRVIGLLAAPADTADAWPVTQIVARAATTGRDVRLVAAPGAARERAARAWLDRLERPDLLVPEAALVEPWRVVAGLDAALVVPTARARGAEATLMPVLWAMAAGVPVLADRGWAGEAVEDDVTGVRVRADALNDACTALVTLLEDAARAGRLADAARDRVATGHGLDDYRGRVGAVHRRLAG
ncbi:MAG: glycosyltransferase family protein [Planctomycetota bacterium]|jgi:hypothetical protein